MLIIGITGGTGSGKTTVVKQIMDALPNTAVSVISQDSYYKDTSKLSPEARKAINFDHPKSIDFKLLRKHLKALKAGKTIAQPVYSFIDHNRTKETVTITPKKVIIVEGILILSKAKLRALFDTTIFIEADSDERLIRRIKRDVAERGRTVDSVLTRYQSTLKPMHKKFIAPTKAYANIIIPNNTYNSVAVNIIATFIKDKLN